MKDRFLIVVEGLADETFIRQYLYHLFGQASLNSSKRYLYA